jgi:hypothetical protein
MYFYRGRVDQNDSGRLPCGSTRCRLHSACFCKRFWFIVNSETEFLVLLASVFLLRTLFKPSDSITHRKSPHFFISRFAAYCMNGILGSRYFVYESSIHIQASQRRQKSFYMATRAQFELDFCARFLIQCARLGHEQ